MHSFWCNVRRSFLTFLLFFGDLFHLNTGDQRTELKVQQKMFHNLHNRRRLRAIADSISSLRVSHYTIGMQRERYVILPCDEFIYTRWRVAESDGSRRQADWAPQVGAWTGHKADGDLIVRILNIFERITWFSGHFRRCREALARETSREKGAAWCWFWIHRGWSHAGARLTCGSGLQQLLYNSIMRVSRTLNTSWLPRPTQYLCSRPLNRWPLKQLR